MPVRVTASIRYRGREQEALVTPISGDRALIAFEEPQRAVTPGQSVVFYRGVEVLGGGIIEHAGIAGFTTTVCWQIAAATT